MSTPSDLEQLLNMGFDKWRAELSIKATGNRKSLSMPFCNWRLNMCDSQQRIRMAREETGLVGRAAED
jgi:hypothetical protein